MSSQVSIECKPNGPYVVRDLVDLRNSTLDSLPTQAVVALCRCGGSANKPFCDGTHQTNGFRDDKLSDANADKLDNYAGAKLTIHDNRTVCAHAGRCTEGLASVFKYGSQPWIDPDGDAAEAIIETIRACPSGALSYSVDGVKAQNPQRDAAITVTKDGPYEMVGSVQLVDASWGVGTSTERYTLCRCGGSKNKPFCDGSHSSIGFKDEKN